MDSQAGNHLWMDSRTNILMVCSLRDKTSSWWPLGERGMSGRVTCQQAHQVSGEETLCLTFSWKVQRRREGSGKHSLFGAKCGTWLTVHTWGREILQIFTKIFSKVENEQMCFKTVCPECPFLLNSPFISLRVVFILNLLTETSSRKKMSWSYEHDLFAPCQNQEQSSHQCPGPVRCEGESCSCQADGVNAAGVFSLDCSLRHFIIVSSASVQRPFICSGFCLIIKSKPWKHIWFFYLPRTERIFERHLSWGFNLVSKISRALQKNKWSYWKTTAEEFRHRWR